MKGATLVPNDVMLLEQPLLRTGLDRLKKNLRNSQRHIEREFQQAQTSLTALSKPGVSQAEAVEAVDAVINRMRGLKRKLSEVSSGNNSAIAATQDRIKHLQDLHDLPGFSTPEYRDWSHKRLARQMADYMLRQGYTRSAEALVQHEGIESLVDIEVFKESSRIEASLQKRSVVEALNWCKENANALKKVKSTLEFDLRYQEFIELVRAHKPAEAIAYSRKHLVPWGATHMQQIRQAMVLLAFGPDTTCPPYKKLFDESWWTTLCTKFRYTLLTLYSLMPLPMLSLSLHTGLAAMKTPSCFSSQPMSSNVDCPTCSTDLGKLAAIKDVPWAHHVNSTIVCKITGKVMEGEDEGREPLALPNGRVYSREALEQMAANNTGKIKCPRTGETYGFHELLKVYIS